MASRSDRSIFGKGPSIAVDFRVGPPSDQGDNEMKKYQYLLGNEPRPFSSFPVHQERPYVYLSTVTLIMLFNP